MCGCCGDRKEDEVDTKVEAPNPLKKRSCTDIIFLIIFLAFVGGMIYVACYGLINGNLYRLLNGYDSYGDICNYNNTKNNMVNMDLSGKDTTGLNYVFFMNTLYPRSALTICVKKCPDRYMNQPYEYYEFAKRTGSHLCTYNWPLDKYNTSTGHMSQDGPCPTEAYESVPILNRCIPAFWKRTNMTADIKKSVISYLNSIDTFQKVMFDLYQVWREILGLCFLALAFSVIMVFIIRFLAQIIVWVIIALSVIGSIAGTAVLWVMFAHYKNKLDEDTHMQIPLLDVQISNEKAFLTFAIIATILTVILLLILLVMRKRVALTVALFKEAGKCVAAMPFLLIQPLWTFLMLILFFVFWFFVLACLSTAGKVEVLINVNACAGTVFTKFEFKIYFSDIPVVNNSTGYINFEDAGQVRFLWIYHLIALIWVSEFILACQELVIAGAVATWYFEREKEKVSCPIGKSVCRTISHHLGSAAFGAFIITLVKFPRMVLMYFEKKMKATENECTKFCLKCCICCLWCLEKCLKYLNRNAYIVIAIEGSNFCSSAKKAFITLLSNVLRVAAINSVGDFMLLLGKLGVMAATAAVGVVIFSTRSDLNYYGVPVIILCMFAFFVAHCFLSIYEMVVDTLLLCFCEDCRINDGSPGREYFMSSTLMKFVKDNYPSL
ncbi:choline transporter-like protein 1 isoform X2 [Tubulanus polymorphus]|uniref:choline transporter-like protein 1 isoform X2 n=1 Tax=Tubulanus polymorphus TaxID=672921 RepID=UPI003DA38021